MRDAQAVVDRFARVAGEDDPAVLDLDEPEAEERQERRRRHVAGEHLLEELEAAQFAADLEEF